MTADQVFEVGEQVDLTAKSKGKGFAGGVKRWHFRGGPKTHGQGDRWRAPGSVGAGTTPGRVRKDSRWPGRWAISGTTEERSRCGVDAERNLVFVRGSAPGHRTESSSYARRRAADMEVDVRNTSGQVVDHVEVATCSQCADLRGARSPGLVRSARMRGREHIPPRHGWRHAARGASRGGRSTRAGPGKAAFDLPCGGMAEWIRPQAAQLSAGYPGSYETAGAAQHPDKQTDKRRPRHH